MKQMLKNNWQYIILACICGIVITLSINPIKNNVAHDDEKNTMISGYSYMRNLSAEDHPELLPLPKIILALPLIFTEKLYAETITPQLIARARMMSLLETLIVLVIVFIVSNALIGTSWALLPTLFTASNPIILADASQALPGASETLSSIIALALLVKFIDKPSRLLLILTGLSIGAALASRADALLFIPFSICTIALYYVTSIARDWSDTDPAACLSRFYVRGFQYFRATATIVGIAIITLYLIYFVGTIRYPMEQQIANTAETTSVLTTNWLAGNAALRPLGAYSLTLQLATQKIDFTPIKILRAIFYERLPIGIIISVGILLGLWQTMKGVFATARHGTRIALDYSATHVSEYILLSYGVLLCVSNIYFEQNTLLHALLPIMLILAFVYIKIWFTEESPSLHRNLEVNVAIAQDFGTAISLKTTILIGLIIWEITATLF